MRPDEWSALSSRISEVKEAEQENEALKERLARISHAFVLVFDVDTEDEAVYIMDVEEEQGVVLAFETKHDAEEYARSLDALDNDSARQLQEGAETSVQALDLEVLVVSSREADFRVAMVFDGDLSITTSGGGLSILDGLSATGTPLFTGAGGAEQGTPDSVTIAVSIVPEDMYAGKTSADFIDPEVDEMFVLVHDAGTADAQYFSINVNRTECICCFKTEDMALTFCRALMATGAALPVPRAVMIDDVREDVMRNSVHGDADRDVCIVDSLAEVLGPSEDGEGGEGGGAEGATEVTTTFVITDEDGEVVGGMEDCSMGGCSVSKTPSVRNMLNRLFEGESGGPEGGA